MNPADPFQFLSDLWGAAGDKFGSPRLPHWLDHELRNRLLLAINHVLQQHPHAQQRLLQQKDKIVHAQWRSLAVRLKVTPAGLFALAEGPTRKPEPAYRSRQPLATGTPSHKRAAPASPCQRRCGVCRHHELAAGACALERRSRSGAPDWRRRRAAGSRHHPPRAHGFATFCQCLCARICAARYAYGYAHRCDDRCTGCRATSGVSPA